MSNKTISYLASIINNSKELNRKEKEILLARLRKKTLKKIGRKYKVTGERIRQIEKEAIVKFIKKTCQLILLD